MLLLQQILTDVSIRCGTSTLRDLETASRRVETEGISFLTITLPAFCSDFQKALAEEQVNPSMFAGFSKHGKLPRFLGGLLDLVFDRGSGRLLDSPSVAAIQALRQVTLAFGKIELECSDERIQTAIQEYVKCESDVRLGDRARSLDDLLDYRRVAHLLWRSLNSRLDRTIYDGELIPSHGPGATADGLRGNQKFTLSEWTHRLEQLFPFVGTATPSWSLWEEVQDRVDFREPGNERPVKVIHVPKTLKAPRIIAEEPTAMMFMQQALLAEMKEEFRHDFFARNLICFDSQVPNQNLARKGSLTGELATLDLKEASDRVSNQLVRELFHYFPHTREAVEAVRSRKADVPGHGVIRLAKYASMGSGLTFPLEAMVFCTLVFLGIERDLNRPLSRKDIASLIGKVRVYGDDIVVPVEHVPSVIRTLELFGARVNTSKSFWSGSFRESCGGDFYAGYPVGVARVRRLLPASRKDGNEVVSMVSLRNQLYELGYERTVDWLDKRIIKILGKSRYPFVTKDSAALGRVHHDGRITVHRMHDDEQRPLVEAYVPSPRIPSNSIDGYPALLKMLLKRSSTPIEDLRHLTHSGRAISVDIKLKWTSPR